jgi:site-specific DNA recombinase
MLSRTNWLRGSTMPSTNGHGPKRAILYARVSTDEQARSGYSLAQQLEALRDYAAREGYEVLEQISDPGQSGASLERPGMDHVRDLVAAGGVSVVLAQDRDRFAREPAYHYLLRREFEEHGTKIRALNDRGDESPEGELTDGILDQLAKFERAKTAERTRRGKLRKAKEGKIVAGRMATFGFDFNEDRDGYVVNKETMAVVRRVFEMVGVEGLAIRTVKRVFEQEEVPTPNGARWWSAKTLRDIILDDCYKPHTFEEVRDLVGQNVAATLNPETNYGISWYGRHRTWVKQVAEFGPGGKRYRRRRGATEKPREQWIAVPVIDSGLPRELVEAAREAIADNRKASSAGHRFWELSGGIMWCGNCGRRMTTCRRRRDSNASKYYHHYRCPKRQIEGADACCHKKYYRAEEVEETVWRVVSDLMRDPEQLRADLERMLEQERQSMRGYPEKEAETWLHKLSEADRKRSGFQDLAAEGLITIVELRGKLAELEETRQTAEKELEKLKQHQRYLEELERDKDAVLEAYAQMAPQALDALTAEERHQLYKMLRVRVTACADGPLEITGMLGKDAGVRKTEPTPGCST